MPFVLKVHSRQKLAYYLREPAVGWKRLLPSFLRRVQVFDVESTAWFKARELETFSEIRCDIEEIERRRRPRP